GQGSRAGAAGEVLDAEAAVDVHRDQLLAALAHRVTLGVAFFAQVDRRNRAAVNHGVVAVDDLIAVDGGGGAGNGRQAGADEQGGKQRESHGGSFRAVTPHPSGGTPAA